MTKRWLVAAIAVGLLWGWASPPQAEAKFGRIFRKIGRAIRRVAKRIGRAVRKVAKKIRKVAKKVGRVVKKVAAKLKKFLPIVSLVFPGFGGIAGKLGKLLGKAGKLGKFIGRAKRLADKVRRVINRVKQIRQIVKSKGKGVLGALKEKLGGTILKRLKGKGKFLGKVGRFVRKIQTKIGGLVSRVLGKPKALLGKVLGKAGGLVTRIQDSVGNILGKLQRGSQGLIGKLTNKARGLLGSISRGPKGVLGKVRTSVLSFVRKQRGENLLGRLKGLLGGTGDQGRRNRLASLVQRLGGRGLKLFRRIGEKARALSNKIGGKVQKLTDKLNQRVRRVTDRIERGVRRVADKVRDKVQRVTDKIGSKVREVTGKLRDKVAKLQAKAQGLYRKAQGVMSRMQQRAQKLRNKLRGKASQLYGALRRKVSSALSGFRAVGRKLQDVYRKMKDKAQRFATTLRTQADRLLAQLNRYTGIFRDLWPQYGTFLGLFGEVPDAALAPPGGKEAGPGAQLSKVVNLCKLAHGFIKAPCAGTLLGRKLLPLLDPIEISGLRATQTLIDLDSKRWMAQSRAWINKGMDWLGVPSRYRIPKRLGYDIEMSIKLSKLQLRIPRGKAFTPELGASFSVRLKVLTKGPLRGKTFSVKGRAEGKLHLTVAPTARECAQRHYPWTKIIANLELTRLNVAKVPNWIDGSRMFLALVNWGLSKAYEDFPAYQARGIAQCFGRCPRSAAKSDVVVRVGGVGLQGKRLSDHRPICQAIDSVLTTRCRDGFLNHLLNAALPIRVEPDPLRNAGLTVSLDKLALDTSKLNRLAATGEASLARRGSAGRARARFGAQLWFKPVCKKDAFLLFFRPTLSDARLTRQPAWLGEEVARAAINKLLPPRIDHCGVPRAREPAGALSKLAKRFDWCGLVDAIFRDHATGPIVNYLASRFLPMRVSSNRLPDWTPDAVKRALDGMTLSVEKATTALTPGATKKATLSAKIVLTKTRQPPLTGTGRFGLRLRTRCQRGDPKTGSDAKIGLRLEPHLEELQLSRIPSWLQQAAVVDLANRAFGRLHAWCVAGSCQTRIAVPAWVKKAMEKSPPEPPCFDELPSGGSR